MKESAKDEDGKIIFNEEQILKDFEGVIEHTWRKALSEIGIRHGLVDAEFKTVNEEARRILETAKKNHDERRRLRNRLGSLGED
jgi:hypothetical protein